MGDTHHRSVPATREESILESFVSLGGGVLLSRVVAFVGTAYLARTLGTYTFGIIGFATAVVTFLAFALRAGFEPIGSREVAREPGTASGLAAGVGLLRLVIAGVGLGFLALVAYFLNKPLEVRQVVFLAGLTLLPLALDPRWVYRGLARNRRAGISMVLAQAVYVATLLLVVKSPQQVFWVPLALVLGETVAVFYLALPLIRNWSGRAEWRRAWGVLRSSGYLVSSSLLDAFIRTTDIVLISLLLGEAQTGVYSAAYRVCFLITAIAGSLHWSYLPRLAQIARNDLPAMRRMTERAFEAAGSLAIPFVVGGWILASPLLGALFGLEYAVGQDAFRLLLLGTGLFFLHGILFQVLVVFDRTRPELTIRGIAVVLNLLLNILLIPRYGIEGAACATVLAEFLILSGRWLVCRTLGLVIGPRFLWKPLGAATGMAMTMLWMAPRVPWLFTFFGGGVIYVALLLLLKGFPRDLRPQGTTV